MNVKPLLTKTALILLLTVAFFNCSKDDDDKNSASSCNESDILFLKEGNSWTYNIGTVGTANGQLDLDIKNCNGEGYIVARNVTNSTLNELLTGQDLWKDSSDFILVDAGENKNAKIYKKNAKLGDTWMHNQADGGVATHEVVSIDSVITVPAGTFTCKVYKYTATDIFNESFIFWNEEIGQIKEDAGFISLELSSYSVD